MHYLITALISMLPLIELRGALIYATVYDLNVYLAYIIAVFANMLPVPFIFLFARKVLLWGKDKKYIGKFFNYCLEKGNKLGEQLSSKGKGKAVFISLMIFVGIPLPGTGAWTGTLAASILNLDFKKSSIYTMLGVMIAGIITFVISYIFKISIL